jgi:pimeloyl-ACP methyl ester carboxylesterase
VYRNLSVVFVLGAALISPVTLTGGNAIAAEIGVVVLHGKNGTTRPKSPTGSFIESLKAAGFEVEASTMPWGRGRRYDETFEDSMEEIDEAVDDLRDDGAELIFVAGHSIGANAALYYGATRDGLAGIIALAPGHVPDIPDFQAPLGDSLARARAMVAAGDGDDSDDFKDMNQGAVMAIDVDAVIYVSFFDPTGNAVMPKNAAGLRPGTALLWINANDFMKRLGRDYAFSKAPPNPMNKYIEMSASHKGLPAAARKKVIEWIQSFN